MIINSKLFKKAVTAALAVGSTGHHRHVVLAELVHPVEEILPLVIHRVAGTAADGHIVLVGIALIDEIVMAVSVVVTRRETVTQTGSDRQLRDGTEVECSGTVDINCA